MISIPPYSIDAIYRPHHARAFAETVPQHVSMKNGSLLRDRFCRGDGVKIAVLDSGASQEHVNNGDLQNAVFDLKSFIHGQLWNDLNGHGSHVAGIIAADNNDQYGTSSILDKCQLHIYKVLDDSGHGDDSSLIGGIRAAIDAGCTIINGSWGGDYSAAVYGALKEAEQSGILNVFASGNSGNRGVIFPAAHNDVCLAIGAVDWGYKITRFSSRGLANDFCDFGYQVYSLSSRGNYAKYSGTSMAAPQVTAMAGAIKGLERRILNREVPRRLSDWIEFFQRFLVDRGRPGHDTSYGHGTIDFAKMVDTYELELMSDSGEDPSVELATITLSKDLPAGTHPVILPGE